MKPSFALMSGILVCIVLSTCQAPLISNQATSLCLSLGNPGSAAKSVTANSGTGARLIDSSTNRIQVIVKDLSGAVPYQNTVSWQNSGIYQFTGLPNGKNFSVTINAINGNTILTTATRNKVDLFAGKVNSISAYLVPETSNMSVACSGAGFVDAPYVNSQYACINYTYNFPITLYVITGDGMTKTNIATINVVDSLGNIWASSKDFNGTYDIWTISGIPVGRVIYVIIMPLTNGVINDPFIGNVRAQITQL